MAKLSQTLFPHSGAGVKQQFVLNCLLARSCVVNDMNEPVRKLRPQLPYSHNVAIVENLSLWTVDVHVKSTIQDTRQMRYSIERENEWEFAATIYPNRGSADQFARLECVEKTSGRNEVLSLFTRDTGQQDTVVLELVIE